MSVHKINMHVLFFVNVCLYVLLNVFLIMRGFCEGGCVHACFRTQAMHVSIRGDTPTERTVETTQTEQMLLEFISNRSSSECQTQ